MFRYIFPFFDPEIESWSVQARLIRWLTFLWLFIGLIALFSASYAVGQAESNDGLYYFKRQLLWGLVGIIAFNIIVRSPMSNIFSVSPWIFLILLGLIFSTNLPGLGTTVNGATRWLKIGPILIQPSELIKPFLVLQSALVFGKWQKIKLGVRITWLIIFAVLLASILLQPNLSTTALCGMTLWLIALAADLPLFYLLSVAAVGICTGVLSISLQDYQRRRVMSFLDPWADAMGDGYQLIQSLLAVGSGGLWGVGFGLSQQKLFYLPIQYTDFIFAVFAEEFGFVGCFLLLMLLLIYATMALIVAVQTTNIIHKLVAIGVMVIMVGQSLLNIGVATGALPTTGLPFPMFSYGGSSLIASLLSAALLVRVAREANQAEVILLDGKINIASPKE